MWRLVLGMREEHDTAEVILARIAARQHGVVSFAQLISIGLDKSAIGRRVAAGRLHRIHHGVYAVGHPGLTSTGHWKAATLALGDNAYLSHRSAAELWELLPTTESTPSLTIVGTAGRRRRSKIEVHRSRSLTRAMTTTRDNTPVTNVARTLADLATVASPKQLRAATRQAEFRGYPLGDAVSDHMDSHLERRFLALCRRGALPEPGRNILVGPYRVDFLWREACLVVEVDDWRSHRGRQAFEDDRARDAELAARGLAVMRFTSRQIRDEPDSVTASVQTAIAHLGSRGAKG